MIFYMRTLSGFLENRRKNRIVLQILRLTGNFEEFNGIVLSHVLFPITRFQINQKFAIKKTKNDVGV